MTDGDVEKKMDNRQETGFSGLKSLLITVIALAAVLVVLLGVFRLKNLKVIGNSRTESTKIAADLSYDFITKNTLYFAWKYRDAVYEGRAPYLEQVKASIESPGTVVLTVEEKKLIGCVMSGKSYVTFDSNGIVMSILDEAPEGIPVIEGIAMGEPTLYQKLPVDNAAVLTAVLPVTQLLTESGLGTEKIIFDENLTITAIVGGVTVNLGQNEYMEEKISNLRTIYERLNGRKGTLNMSAFTGDNETITFDELEPETQAEEVEETEQTYTSETFQCFDSYGNLFNDARVVNGVVVDSAGNAIEGCSVNDEGNVVDGYMNVIVLNLPEENRPGYHADTTEETEESGDTSGAGETSVETQINLQGDAAAEETPAEEAPIEEAPAEEVQNEEAAPEEAAEEENDESSYVSAFQAFDSNGTLHNDAHVVNGEVVDAYGNPLAGCYINENGNVVDAYWNEIDPHTGQLAQ